MAKPKHAAPEPDPKTVKGQAIGRRYGNKPPPVMGQPEAGKGKHSK